MRASRGLASALSVTCAAVIAACGGGGDKGGNGTPVKYAISGTVTGTTGVTVTLSGIASATTTTVAGGAYSFTGLASGAYTVTPSKAGFTFTPASRPVTVNGADVTGQDFAAAADVHSISGTVTGTTGVTVTLSGTASRTTTTDGAYSFTGLASGAYTVTPSKTGFTFTPASRPVTVTGADVAAQDFAASPIGPGTHAISGTVTGTVIQGVKVTLATGSGSAIGSTVTDASGAYSFPSLADGAYVATPSLLDAGVFHVFTPPRRQVTVSGADVGGLGFSGTPLAPFEDFSSGKISGARWDSGEHRAQLAAQQAVLRAAIDAPAANTAYGTSLIVAPGAVTGRTTALRAVVQLTSSSLTGDAVGRAGIDLLFQPPEDRVASPDNQANALYVRVALQGSASGLVAVRQVFECLSPPDDCTSTQPPAGVTVVSGGTAWPGTAGLGNIALNTPYTISITFDTATNRFTFSLQGGFHATAVTTTLDLSSVASRITEANFYRSRLLAHVRGTAGGAGNGGPIEAAFDDVRIGVNGQTAANAPLFDDFSAGTTFDPGRWTVGGASAQIASGALEVQLQQRDSPETSGLTLDRSLVPAPRALQAKVTVLSFNKQGLGQVGARLLAALYNDGSAGVGPPPDVNKASSQVGDVLAQISVTDTDVSYAVLRCNLAVCTGPKATTALGGVTFVVERTSLLTTTLNTAHLLLLRWDAASHQVVFQVDDLPPAVIDPTAGPKGLPVAGGPRREVWNLSNHTGASAQNVDFSAGSSADIRSRFELVKKL